MKVIFASHNKDKEKEVKEILRDLDIVTLSDLNDKDDVLETGNTLEENAYLKALHYFKKYRMPVISDDSGLFIEALNGEPGIYSARYSGENATYKTNCEKVIKKLEDENNRNAYFACVICYIDEEGITRYFEGRVNGTITEHYLGEKGFGYDPIFFVEEMNKTMFQMTSEEKNSISHRKRGLEKFANYLREKRFEKMVEFTANEILDKKDSMIEKRLMGGMSNYTYVISSNDNYYTIRFPGEYAENFVDREKEARNIKLMEKLGITNKTIYLDITSGIKMARYLEGTPLSEINNYPYEKVSEVLKKIHNSKEISLYDYKPFERLENYEKLNKDLEFVFPSEYQNLKEEFFKYKDYLEKQEKVLCHGDSQPSNFILTSDNNLYTVDFEFASNNDPIYDIACFANLKLEDGLKLLSVYYSDLDKDKILRFYLWRCFQCFQWFNVATFKELVGMSISLGIDFKKVSEKYLENIKNLLTDIRKIK